jgi:hypothetical protein
VEDAGGEEEDAGEVTFEFEVAEEAGGEEIEEEDGAAALREVAVADGPAGNAEGEESEAADAGYCVSAGVEGGGKEEADDEAGDGEEGRSDEQFEGRGSDEKGSGFHGFRDVSGMNCAAGILSWAAQFVLIESS